MVLRIVLGAVYTAMAVGQLASFGSMPGTLAEYGLVNGVAATALAVALIAGELVCGVWFLARPRSKALPPVWVFTAVSVVWSLLAVQAYARGLTVPNCGCFGIYLTQRLSWFVLVQDALTLFYAGLLLHGGRVTATPAEHGIAGRDNEQDEAHAIHDVR
ncbi:MauE/DoxX family redox-associated membrane protein [Streptomyces sp. 8N616]|uniref:MauE/DoxX family redox-associated membrane protein n=1 Tax=Streptomyces sp. 8N616 TaxID=3457414 RepID=UPI003FD31C55